MDLVCLRCGEPWDLDTVLHDEPESFQRGGAAIYSCPCCERKRQEELPAPTRRMQLARVLTTTLGDDVDGAVALLEDVDTWED